eukprot:32224-Pelagomonas_calceolata.AAC.4
MVRKAGRAVGMCVQSMLALSLIIIMPTKIRTADETDVHIWPGEDMGAHVRTQHHLMHHSKNGAPKILTVDLRKIELLSTKRQHNKSCPIALASSATLTWRAGAKKSEAAKQTAMVTATRPVRPPCLMPTCTGDRQGMYKRAHALRCGVRIGQRGCAGV